MLLINVRLPENRDHAAVVDFGSSYTRKAAGFAAASVSAEIASQHGNASCDPLRPWGHPPSGGYQLIAHGPAPKGCENEYGKTLLAFQPISGAALDAESYGRLTLLAYAGPVDGSDRLRRTQGGLRFDPKVMKVLVALLARETEVVLQISPARKPAWSWLWKFLNLSLPAIPLSPELPRFRAPPLDEATLAEALSAGKRRARPVPTQTDDRDWNDRDRSSSSSSSSSSNSSYSGGRGGEYGGAGASGSWDNAAASGAGRGVDASGRISATVAAAATVAALQASADSGGASDSAGTVDTSTGTNY